MCSRKPKSMLHSLAGLAWVWLACRAVCAICGAVSCRVISEFIWINRFADATKCPLLAAKRCEACNVRHRHLLWQHVRWWWRQRRRLEQPARQSQILHNIPTGSPGTFGSLSHGGWRTQRVAHGAGGALQCHVNKLCSGFSATHTQHKHTTWVGRLAQRENESETWCSCFCMSHISRLIYVQYMRVGKIPKGNQRTCEYIFTFFLSTARSFNKLQIASDKCKQINVKNQIIFPH